MLRYLPAHQLLAFISLCVLVNNTQGRSIRQRRDDDGLWHPENGVSRDEFFRCKGLPCPDFDEARTLLALAHGPYAEDPGDVQRLVNTTLLDMFGSCAAYTPQQARIIKDAMDQERSLEGGRHRAKRKIFDFLSLPENLWPNPLFYRFDGTHDREEQDWIRRALNVWEQRTCLAFLEVGMFSKNERNQLLFTKQSASCFAYVGHTGYNPQIVNIGANCFQEIGTAIHEIGHSLGLWHEHQRADRDDYVTINHNNLFFGHSQFFKQHTISQGLPYDFGSVMHYPPTAGSVGSRVVIEAKNPWYQDSMGQRQTLSYLDAKIINNAYCSNLCDRQPLQQPCLNGGYQNQKTCRGCICPDGFSGAYCEDVAPGENAVCGGTVNLVNKTMPYMFHSPGYEKSEYQNNVKCSWLIKAPIGHRPVLRFQGNFALFKISQTCAHYVEVKYSSLEFPGPRFCGYKTPDAVIKGETREMLVNFVGKYDGFVFATARQGFLAVVEYEPFEDLPPSAGSGPRIEWSDWGPCDPENKGCPCGSCAYKFRYKICDGKACNGTLEETMQQQRCSKACTDQHLKEYFEGVVLPCPKCCFGFSLQADGYCR